MRRARHLSTVGGFRRAMSATVQVGPMVAVLVVAGCDNPKAASKAHFQKALTAFFDKKCAMFVPGVTSFPADMTATSSRHLLYINCAKLRALKQVGLLTSHFREDDLKAVNGMTVAPGYKLKFELTTKGRSLYRPPNSLAPGSPAGFCAGHLQIVSVDNFTDPVVVNSEKVSRVTFTMRARYDGWTKAPALQTAFRALLSQTQPASLTLPLVLMNDGWAVSIGNLGQPLL